VLSNRLLGGSTLSVSPVALGGNVFGWTADRRGSHDVLDAYVRAGGNFIDTSDSYSFWAPGNTGGESEEIIGAWLASGRRREDVVLATKVSQHPDFVGIDPATVARGIDASLSRLGVDHVDLYYAHFDEPHKPLAPTVEAFSRLVDQGKIREVGISNFSHARIEDWLRIADENGWRRPVAIQPPYSLVDRRIEFDILPLASKEGLTVVSYYSLARGFLTGKYRTGSADAASPRAEAAAGYLTEDGRRILSALDAIAQRRGVESASVAIAWVIARPNVVPIASARDLRQLAALLAAMHLELDLDELAALDEASTPASS
jgi:aryl-alcohol dehydrogenase-like predicted oxidoreductase